MSRSFPLGRALRESLRAGYGLQDLRGDLLAGLTVGVVAVPLAMALAIASGVPPQYGLYTSIVAGALIALTGGARYNVSGPTAAFVVVLLPVTHQYGVGGLLVTTVLAGLILIAMGASGLGRLVRYIPYPVTTGFTAGIGLVIALLQVKDLLGLRVGALPADFLDKLLALAQALPTVHAPDLAIGLLTLAVLLGWPRLKTPIPGHLVALVVGTAAAWAAAHMWSGFEVATIGSRFEWSMDGLQGRGIPPLPPLPVLPWLLPDANGQPLGLSLGLVRELLPSAFTIAMLGAIESLLCAVVADGLGGTRHDPNAELVGQGLGNVVAPFFGGITATGAIARTATNIRAGARSPIAAVVHAGVVLLAVVALAPLLGMLPMAALAALLIVVAWNMSEAKHFANIVRGAPGSDVLVLLSCFGLTVVFDMVLAVSVGVVLASLLFIRRMSELTSASVVEEHPEATAEALPAHVAVYDINGPLFFGAAEKAASALHQVDARVRVLIIDMSDVSAMDITGIVALDSMITRLNRVGTAVVVRVPSPRLYRKLLRAGMRKQAGRVLFATSREGALRKARELSRSVPRTAAAA